MKSLKIALLVTTAAGAVAAGGVTYATVGNSSPAPSAQAVKDTVAKKVPAAGVPEVPGVPAVPTCLPDLPKGEALTAAKAKIKEQIEALAAKAPATPVKLPDASGKLPKVLTAAQLAKLPVDKLPTCKAGENKAKSVTPPKVPGHPGLPALPVGASCDKVPAVIKNQEARAKDFALPNGMHVGASHAHSIVIQSRKACEYTQAFVKGAKTLVTVDRITTPPQVTIAEVAESLKMAGSFVSVSGVDTWTTPENNGMLWYSKDGYAIRLTGTGPASAALLPAIATQLRAQ
jgi:hypothetical protein